MLPSLRIATVRQTEEDIHALLFWWIILVLGGYPGVNYFQNIEHVGCEVPNQPNCLLITLLGSVRSNLFIRTLLWEAPLLSHGPIYNLYKINELMCLHVVHNECDHFTTRNWEAFKPNGWIAKQSANSVAAKHAAE